MSILNILTLCFSVNLLFSLESRACTGFCITNERSHIVGKSYDWIVDHGHGVIYTNLRGTRRFALNLENLKDPLKWTSRYGSLSFTQFGKGFPIDGINEKGLVIEILLHKDAQFNEFEVGKPFVNMPQWVQYQLDTYATTADVLRHLDELRLVKSFVGLHVFLSDASGDSATIDFLDGKPLVHTGSTLPIRALTNSSYDNSLGAIVSVEQSSSLPRFKIAAHHLEAAKSLHDDQLQDAAWSLLTAVQTQGFSNDAPYLLSQWNITMNPVTGEIRWRTLDSPTIKSINLNSFDFNPEAQELMLNLNTVESGEVRAHFEPYSAQKNAELIHKNAILISEDQRNAAIFHATQEQTCAAELNPHENTL